MPDGLGRDASCRHCGAILTTVFADLGVTPVANDYLSPARRDQAESFYPLKAYVCGNCRLVQLRDFHGSRDLFREDYAYFSSFSTSWLQHAKNYAEYMRRRLRLGPQSLVVEVASNDGYLLQYFKQKGIPVLGIEPCRSVADFAIAKIGIPTRIEFFGRETAIRLADEGFSADLAVANNVLGHVPDINDFVSGFAAILEPDGVATFEFPHLLNLIRLNEFDTIYHEHFSYLSLLAAERIFPANGLRIFDVERLSTHGGSLRLFACRTEAVHERTHRVDELAATEREAGLHTDEPYIRFSEQVRETKRSLLELLIALKRQGHSIVGYGAPAKGNTLLNYCGIGGDTLDFTVDRSPHKQGLFLPGTRLEIRAPEAIDRHKPDFVLILPWNLQDEVMSQLAHIGQWGGKFIVPIPRARIVDAPRGPHLRSGADILDRPVAPTDDF
ncbi:class I SAM-dependent methyltransferase [Enhydrobacter sp.]|jgi:SAM-dependent methyltransferase|uniref:class I SAM-dependent methyltransferase n=1 Tax=Enhydrobacter sp. TaxID=1894999 RepID=UPI00262BAAD2|nr:class I SAM-dependent methyltransferase [Enhydrobacter sp.]WIM10066.1 MAG: SAM-dependent methyltransferase [Enhydrobacter sp.]